MVRFSNEQEAVGPISLIDGSTGLAGKVAPDRHGCSNRAVDPAARLGRGQRFDPCRAHQKLNHLDQFTGKNLAQQEAYRKQRTESSSVQCPRLARPDAQLYSDCPLPRDGWKPIRAVTHKTSLAYPVVTASYRPLLRMPVNWSL